MKKYTIYLLVLLLVACSTKELIQEDDNIELIEDIIQEPSIESSSSRVSKVSDDSKSASKKVDDLPKDDSNKAKDDVEKPSKKKDSKPKSSNNKKAEDKITYGDVEFIDGVITFNTLDPKYDNSKDKGTSGLIIKGKNGSNRKEVRDVYINGSYSHTEVIKDTYILENPIHEQAWIGTKEKPKERACSTDIITFEGKKVCKNELNIEYGEIVKVTESTNAGFDEARAWALDKWENGYKGKILKSYNIDYVPFMDNKTYYVVQFNYIVFD